MRMKKIALTVAFVAIMLGCVVAITPTQSIDAAEGEVDIENMMSAIKEGFGDGWEAGLSLQLTDDGAYTLAKAAVDELPESFTDTIPLLAFLKAQDENGTIEDVYEYLSNGSMDLSAEGSAYAFAIGTKTDEGYQVDLRIHATMSFTLREVMDYVDSENPETELWSAFEGTVSADFAILLIMADDMAPTSLTINQTMEMEGVQSDNYEWDETDWDYTLTPEEKQNISNIQKSDMTINISGLTAEIIDSIVNVDDYRTEIGLEVFQSYSSSNTSGDETVVSDGGHEEVSKIEIEGGVLTAIESEYGDAGTLLPEEAVNLYDYYETVQAIFEKMGIYLSQELYVGSLDALASFLGMLVNGDDLQLYYSIEGSVYNGNAKDAIVQAVSGIESDPAESVVGIDGEYSISYNRTDLGNYTITAYRGDAEVPTNINGIPAVMSPSIAEPIEFEYLGFVYSIDQTGNIWRERVADNATEATVTDVVYYENKTYDCTELNLYDIVVDRLIIDFESANPDHHPYLSLGDSWIGELVILDQININVYNTSISSINYDVDADYINVDWAKNVNDLRSLTYGEGVQNVYGTIESGSMYIGAGSVYSDDQTNVVYRLGINQGVPTAFALHPSSNNGEAYDFITLMDSLSLSTSDEEEPVEYQVNAGTMDYGGVTQLTVSSIPDEFRVSSSDLEYVLFDNKNEITLTDGTFDACDVLDEVYFAGPVGTIGGFSFIDCTEITELGFGGTVEKIEPFAFGSGLPLVTELWFQKDVGVIDSEAFGSFTKLKSIQFDGNVKRIEWSAFTECPALSSILTYGNLGYIAGFDECPALTSITIEGDLGEISAYAFENRKGTESLEFAVQGNVGTIGYGAFRESNIKTFSVDGNVETISEEAFRGSSITTFGVNPGYEDSPTSIQSIETNAFSNTPITIESIDSVISATKNCDPLAFSNLLIDETVEGDRFDNLRYTGISSGFEYTYTSADGSTFSYNLFKFTDSETGVTEIAANIIGIWYSQPESFEGEPPVVGDKLIVTIPQTVNNLDETFNVRAVGYSGYYYNSDSHHLDLTIGNNVKIIGHRLSSMFADGTGSITIKTAGYTSKLEEGSGLYMVLDSEGNLITTIDSGDVGTGTFVVPDGIEKLDLGALGLADITTINTNGVVSLTGWGDLSNLSKIIIGPALKNLELYNIPASVSSFEMSTAGTNEKYVTVDGVLYSWVKLDDGSTALELVKVPPSIPDRGSFTVNASVTIDGTEYDVVSIGSYAFSDSRLGSVVIEAGVDEILFGTFEDSAITSISLPAGIVSIDSNAFDRCNSELKVTATDDSVYTTDDGAIYLKSKLNPSDEKPTLQMITYIGESDTLFVEEGTEIVGFGVTKGTLKYIILPEETRLIVGNTFEYEDGIVYVLGPDTLYQDTNWDWMGCVFRSYTVSDEYSVEIDTASAGVLISVSLTDSEHYDITGLRFGEQYGTSKAFSYNELFPIEEVPPNAVYEERIEVVYDKNAYTVTYHTFAGGTITQSVHWNEYTYWEGEDPARGGYVFDGWFADSGCTEPFDFDSPIVGPTDVYAGWTPVYSVTFVGDNVDFFVNGMACDSEIIQLTADTYWFDAVPSDGYGGEIIMTIDGIGYTGGEYQLTHSITLTATGTVLLPTHYTVTFVNNPLKGSCDVTYLDVPIGESIDLPEVRANDGFRFVGWTSGMNIFAGQFTPGSDMTLTASYATIPGTSIVSFSINANMGKVVGSTSSLTVDDGTTITLPQVNAKNRFTFLGWTADGNIIESDTYTVNGDVRLKAVFDERASSSGNTVSVILHVDNSEGVLSQNHVITVSPGETIELPDLREKRGFTLVAWSMNGSAVEGNTITVTENVTVTAIFQQGYQDPEVHTVAFTSGSGGTIGGPSTMIVLDGQAIEMPTATPNGGYRFDGWYVDGVRVDDIYNVTGDVTITATFSLTGGGNQGGNQGGNTDPEPDEGETTTTTDENGNTIQETVRPDGSTTTITTAPDGSSTKVDTAPIENGTQTTEEVYDSEGNLTGSTTVTETEVETETGNTVSTVTQTVTDATGQSTTNTTITSTNDSGNIQTNVSMTDSIDGQTVQSTTTVTVPTTETGAAAVDPSTVAEALQQMQEATPDGDSAELTVKIQPEGYTPDRAEVVIDQIALQTIRDSGAKLEVSGDIGTISVPTEVAGNLSEIGGDVSMSISTANKSVMTSAQQERVGDAPVFELSANAGDQSVHELGGDVVITLPYTLSEGESPDDIRVFYLDDDGGLHVRTTTYDTVTHTISFVTDHFSYYMIGTVADLGDQSQDGGDNTAYYIIAAVVAIAVVAVVAVTIRRHT